MRLARSIPPNLIRDAPPNQIQRRVRFTEAA
jgi:hypothetical protein